MVVNALDKAFEQGCSDPLAVVMAVQIAGPAVRMAIDATAKAKAGELGRAISLFNSASILFRKLRQHDQLAMAFENKGRCCYLMGGLEKSLALFQESIAISDENDLHEQGASSRLWVAKISKEIAELTQEPSSTKDALQYDVEAAEQLTEKADQYTLSKGFRVFIWMTSLCALGGLVGLLFRLLGLERALLSDEGVSFEGLFALALKVLFVAVPWFLFAKFLFGNRREKEKD